MFTETLAQFVELILGLAVVGFLVYLITEYIPMPPIFKNVIYVVVVVAAVLWLLKYFA